MTFTRGMVVLWTWPPSHTYKAMAQEIKNGEKMILVSGGPDFYFIVLAAVRYAIGRMTYAPSLVIEWCKTNRAALPDGIWRNIKEELDNEIRRDDRVRATGQEGCYPLGTNYDRASWISFRNWLAETFSLVDG